MQTPRTIRSDSMPVAPHLNNEVRLVMGGLKPLATIEKAKDPIGYSLAVSLINAGSLAGAVGPTVDSPIGEVVLVKPKNYKLIDEYLYLLDEGVKQYGLKEFHWRMGKLFGYSDQDIADFIAAEINCDCSKCRGH